MKNQILTLLLLFLLNFSVGFSEVNYFKQISDNKFLFKNDFATLQIDLLSKSIIYSTQSSKRQINIPNLVNINIDSNQSFKFYQYNGNKKDITNFTNRLILIDNTGNEIGSIQIEKENAEVYLNNEFYTLKIVNKTKNEKNKLQANQLIVSSLIGGNGDDHSSTLKIDSKGNIIIAGSTTSTFLDNMLPPFSESGMSDLFVAKFNKNYQIQWVAKIGGNSNEYFFNLEIDKDDKIWFCGQSNSYNYFTTTNCFQSNNNGNADGIITSFTTDGNVHYSTYFGGGNYDALVDLTIDSLNNIWATGRTTSPNMFCTNNALDKSLDELYESPLIKFDNSGNIIYSSFFGGSSQGKLTLADCIETDTKGNIIISGYSNSSNIPITNGAYQPYLSGSYDSFITKINSTNYLIEWSTYLGGTASDYASSVAIDKSDNIYVLTFTKSLNLPVINSSIQNQNNGNVDAYISKFSRDCKLLNSAYFGGSSDEGSDYDALIYIYSHIAISPDNRIFLLFKTISNDIQTKNSEYSDVYIGGIDAFVAILNPNFTLEQSFYFGGSGNDNVGDLAIINDSTYIISGNTISNNFPLINTYKTYRDYSAYDGFFAVFGISDKPDIDDKAPEITSSVIDDCNIEHTILLTDTGFDNSGIKSVEILEENNCKVSYTVNSTECKIIVKLLNTDNIGYYKIKVTDNSNNSTEIDDNIGPRDDGILDVQPNDLIEIKPIQFSLSSNQFITIYNISAQDVTLDKLTLLQNLHFSIPQSQFPLLIRAMDSAQIEIVFMPNFPLYEDIYYDTLVIEDVCGNHIIPLHSDLLHSIYSSDSKCEVELQFNTDLVADKPLIKSILSDGNNLQIELNEFNEDILIEISDIEGKTLFKQVETKRINNIIVPINQMSNQLYLLKIADGNNYEIYKILIK